MNGTAGAHALRLGFLLLLAAAAAAPSESATAPSESDAAVESEATAQGDARATADGALTMSGMSILGNHEAPTSLVIVPWRSSEIGDGIGLGNALNAEGRPVDREVFLRELRYYEIRRGE